MGTETSLHGDSDIHGACFPSVPQSFQGMTCVNENYDSWEDVRGVTHPLKGLGAPHSVIQCPVWKSKQGAHLVINLHRANE